MSTVELTNLIGDRTEYAVRVTSHPGATVPYVFGARWVRAFAEGEAKRISDPTLGFVAEVVERTVTFGEWQACESSETDRG